MKAQPYLNLILDKGVDMQTYKLEIVYGFDKADNPFNTLGTRYEIVEGHTVFLLPGCLIESKKFTLLNKKFGLKKTLDINKADVIFRPKKLTYFTNKRVIKTNLKTSWNASKIKVMIEAAHNITDPEIQNFLRSNSTFSVIVPLTYGNSYSATSSYGSKPGFFNSNFGLQFYDKANIREIELFLKAKPFEVTAPVHVDADLLKHQINKKGMVFDEETFLNIGRMITSNDSEGKAMIVDLMTNADYDESALYILVLLKEYSRYFPNLDGTTRKSFRAMLGYFNIDPKRVYFLELDDITNALKSIGKYDQKHMEEFLRIQKHLIAYTMGMDVVGPKASCIDDADEIEL